MDSCISAPTPDVEQAQPRLVSALTETFPLPSDTTEVPAISAPQEGSFSESPSPVAEENLPPQSGETDQPAPETPAAAQNADSAIPSVVSAGIEAVAVTSPQVEPSPAPVAATSPFPPGSWNGFIGQPELVRPLRKLVQAAKRHCQLLPHVLLSGPSGVGKTALAHAIAAERGTSLHIVLCSDRMYPEDLQDRLRSVKAHDIIFLDEAHGLEVRSQELLMGIIDSWHAGPKRAKEPGSSQSSIPDIAGATFILATDQPSKLVNALAKRLGIHRDLRPYSNDDMIDIGKRLAAAIGILPSAQALRHLAEHTRGLPRNMRHFLEHLRLLHFEVEAAVNTDDVKAYLRDHGWDRHGNNPREQQYLRLLMGTTAASLGNLSAHLGVDEVFISRQLEPRFCEKGWIDIGARGRSLTDAARALFQKGQV